MSEIKLRFPQYLNKIQRKLSFINVWASKKITKSNWHFDAYLNFNYILWVTIFGN